MKKIILALVAFMLVLGMTQCKKEQPTPTPEPTPDGETVYISMKVDDGGAKHIVYPGTGAYVFENGDVIYVGNNGKYVGKLTYANGTFSGSITSPSTSDYLHFYFTGGKAPSTAPTAGSTTSFTVDISDQSSKLPVLSYGHSTTKYIDGTTAYTCMLENQCGLVKFVPSVATNEIITVSGMKTTATIDFATPGITPTNTTGDMSLYSANSNEKWAILLPQDEVVNPIVNLDGFVSTITSVPAVTPNMYYTTGVNISIVGFPIGAIHSLFTINSNGGRVAFSQGNLQYRASTNTWRFAQHQWDHVGTQTPDSDGFYGGTVSGSDNRMISSTYSGWIDLFGWGTSGWNSGAVCYQPYSTSSTNSDYLYNHLSPIDLTGDYANADWGVYNAITNGGNASGLWRTLTYYEWNYVFYSRTDAALKYGLGSVGGENGLILLPDNWMLPTGLYFSPGPTAAGANSYTTNQWTLMENNGAVFLPVTGYRYDIRVFGANCFGAYWSASRSRTVNTGSNANCVDFSFAETDNIYNVINNNDNNLSSSVRRAGLSVRLVQDLN